MKRMLFYTLVALLMVPNIRAQVHLFLEERQVQLEDGNTSGWVFPVVHDLEEALKDLEDFCKDRSDIKLKKAGDNLVMAEKVSVPAIATKRGDLIGYGFSAGTQNELALVFKLGYDIALNSEEWETEMNNFHNYARQFMAYHYEQSYNRRMEEIDDQIKTLEKEKDRIEKDIVQLNRRIENNSSRIERETDEGKLTEYRNEIASYESDITLLNNDLPPIISNLEQLQTKKEQLNTEAHTYLGTIGSL